MCDGQRQNVKNNTKRQHGKKTTWQKDKNDKKDNPTGDISFFSPAARIRSATRMKNKRNPKQMMSNANTLLSLGRHSTHVPSPGPGTKPDAQS